jgi:RNA polymerase sigma-70 factor (ECF subfamily)
MMALADNETLQKVLGSLPTAQREVIVLKHIEDLSYREIAQSLRIPLGTVMSRLSRARAATCRQSRAVATDGGQGFCSDVRAR